jgi:Tfp pilus assembly protein PilW
MSSCEMGLIEFFIASLIIVISAQISLERMSRQLRQGKENQAPRNQEKSRQKK